MALAPARLVSPSVTKNEMPFSLGSTMRATNPAREAISDFKRLLNPSKIAC